MISETNQAILQSGRDSIKLQREKIEAQRQAVILQNKIEERKVELKRANRENKEKAWRAYFKTPEDCLSYKSDKHMVECANMRIRAKKEFEEKWLENQQ
ncbi:hypothetical protein DFR28_1052 [Arenicella xantha]|uniref:Uncharacterized protein n=2 Tax=Arenicella xantha TaxID=644221 RepID=A0A395JJ19_9GAMM|nr:hypothetical protein DFR28_1052 [Arenicella xantha]